MSQPDFTVEISHNEYLPEGGDDINAIVTVTSPTVASEDGGRAGPAADAGCVRWSATARPPSAPARGEAPRRRPRRTPARSPGSRL